jgi:hypothetical protein
MTQHSEFTSAHRLPNKSYTISNVDVNTAKRIGKNLNQLLIYRKFRFSAYKTSAMNRTRKELENEWSNLLKPYIWTKYHIQILIWKQR